MQTGPMSFSYGAYIEATPTPITIFSYGEYMEAAVLTLTLTLLLVRP